MFIQLCSWDNLLLAYRRAARGKRGHANVACFEHYLEDNLLALQQELLSKTYRPGAYRSFTIHEPKRRLISAAPFKDRVVHHAICNIVEPIFERSFIYDSYANRKGKGTHRALDRAQHFARRNAYVLQCDLEQFFPSIDHAILRGILSCKIIDPDVMWLVNRVLESGQGVLDGEYRTVYFPGDDLFAVLRPRGLPIGNLTSQFWANVYLNPLDHFIKRHLKCKGYLRYVDDLLLFGDSKKVLWDYRSKLCEQLALLRLTLHSWAHPRPVTEGFPFLGFIVYPDRRRLKRRNVIQFRCKFKMLIMEYIAGKVEIDQVDDSVRGWVNHACYANTIGLRKALLGLNITALRDIDRISFVGE